MESKLLEKEAGVRVSSKQGPPSGRGTTLTVTYIVDMKETGINPVRKGAGGIADPGAQGHPGVALFFGLRGLGADLYDADGGGEAWLTRERLEFYGAGKKELE
jgi:hypothetical protein